MMCDKGIGVENVLQRHRGRECVTKAYRMCYKGVEDVLQRKFGREICGL